MAAARVFLTAINAFFSILDSAIIIFGGKGGFQLEYYFVTAGAIRDEHGVVHRTYGIALWKDGGVRRKIEDISTNKHHVKLMAGCMNRRRVASVHFEGVVEDMLACGSPRVAKNKSFFSQAVRHIHIAAIY